MKIGIDARCLEWNRGGVARYLINMLKLWPSMTDEHQFTLYFQNQVPQDDFLQHPIYKLKLLRGPEWLKKRRILAEQILMPRQVKEEGLDLFYAAWYSAPMRLRVKTVVGAWDISYSTNPEQYSLATRISLGYFSRRSCEKAAGVVTCSDYDAEQIAKYYGIPPDRICTVYLAADDRFSPNRDELQLAAVRRKYELPERFILSLGVIHSRRNVDVIINAFQRIKEEFPRFGLVVVGNNYTRPHIDIDGIIKPLVDEGRAVRMRWFDDHDLVDLYRAAHFFISTSTVDGETLLLKEAMKSGVPVITSPLLSGTIGGNGYIITNPKNIEETAAVMRQALSNNQKREELILRGIEWNHRFSWENVARVSLDFLESSFNRPLPQC